MSFVSEITGGLLERQTGHQVSEKVLEGDQRKEDASICPDMSTTYGSVYLYRKRWRTTREKFFPQESEGPGIGIRFGIVKTGIRKDYDFIFQTEL